MAQRLCLEVRPDGIAWAIAPGEEHQEVGFSGCTPAKRAEVLEKLVGEYGWEGVVTTVVLPLDQYQVFQVERPEGVEDAELADALKWKLKDFLDFSPAEAVCDVFSFPEDASRGRGELVNVVAVRKSVVSELVRLVQQAGLSLDKIDIAELALRNLAARLEGPNPTAALVHLRDRYGQMVICKGSTLYLSRRLDVPYEDLQDVSRQENAVQSLALELQRSLDYYESQLRQVPPPSIEVVTRDASLPLASMMGSYVASSIVMLDWEKLGFEGTMDSRCVPAWSAGLPEGDAR